MRILWVMLPGVLVGFFVFDSFRKIFSDDDKLIRRLFADQPVSMVAAATIVGSTLVWAVLHALGLL
jgi:hypothetical protein